MYKKIPTNVIETKMHSVLSVHGIERIVQGTNKDLYRLDTKNLLMCYTNRLKIFDFILPVEVPEKAQIAIARMHFWFTQIFPDFPNHLINDMDGINAIHELAKEIPDIDKRCCLVIRDLTKDILDSELIIRPHIGGSVYQEYLKHCTVGGQAIAPNYPKWSKLNSMVFNPSTKSALGHDENYEVEIFYKENGFAGKEWINKLFEICARAYNYAEERGIIFMDTRFEGTLYMLADEIFTADSTRFIYKKDWQAALENKIEPSFFDASPVKRWGMGVATNFGVIGLNNLDPRNYDHVNFVHSLTIPEKIITDTTKNDHKLFELQTGHTLKSYQKNFMNC